MKKKKERRYSLIGAAFFINLCVIFTAYFLWTIIDAFDEFNPLDQIFNDFDYTDLYFSEFGAKVVPPDTNIYIVNIGGYPYTRLDIARQINVLQQFEPRVIAVDAVFAERKGFEDFALKQALNQKNNVVLGVFGVYDDETDELVGYKRSNEFFGEFPFGHLEFQSYPKTTRDYEKYIIAYDTITNKLAHEILNDYYALLNDFNLMLQKQPQPENTSDDDSDGDAREEETWDIVDFSADSAAMQLELQNLKRAFLYQVMFQQPAKGFKQVQINAFTTEIMRLYDTVKYERFLKRGMREEIINFRGGSMPFIFFEAEDIVDSNENLERIRDKIVLMGYVKQDLHAEFDTIDSHFTPMKRSPTGHACAKGVEVHAHILSMILNEDYIDHWPAWTNYLIALLVNQLFLMFFCYIYVYKTDYFDVITKPTQFIGLVIVLWLMFFVFDTFSFKIDLVPAVIAIILSIEVLYLVQETFELLRVRTYLTQHIDFEGKESRITLMRRKLTSKLRKLFQPGQTT